MRTVQKEPRCKKIYELLKLADDDEKKADLAEMFFAEFANMEKQIKNLSDSLHQSEDRNGRRVAEIMRLNNEIKEPKEQLNPPLYRLNSMDGTIERVEPQRHLKLLPQFIDKVADGSKTIHIKKRPLPLGVYEVVNGETGKPMGLFVRVTKCIEETTSYVLDQFHVFYTKAGFRDGYEAMSFYGKYLEGSTLCYLHVFERVEKPEAGE